MIYEQAAGAKETPGLEDYLAAVRRRKWLVILCGLLGLVAAFLFTSNRTENYTARAKVLVNPTNVGTLNQGLARPVLEREREVIASNAIARLVVEDLAITTSPLRLLRTLEVTFVDKSDTLEVRFTHPDPDFAQDVTNSFASNYVEKRVGEAVALDEQNIAELQAALDELDTQVADFDAAIEDLISERTRLLDLGLPTQNVTDELQDLRSLLNNVRGDQRTLTRELRDVVITQNTRTPPAEVLQFADRPGAPIGFSSNILLAAGLILGTGSGVGLAFVLQRLDRTARESRDVELALGTNVLASIPPFGLGLRARSSMLVMTSHGRSTRIQKARESFRRLRSSLQFLGSSRNADTFLITSARPGEGKSTTAANLAVTLAQGDTKVCLLNSDLRRPTIERLLGTPTSPGISEWLADPTITDIMQPAPGVPGLVVVPAGSIPSNPGELLATNRMADLIDELKTQFDIVIVDAPPLLSAADASAITGSVDGTIIVVDASRTDTDTLLRVRDEIGRAGGSIVGAVLNRDRSDTGLRLRKDHYAYEKVSAARSAQ